MTGTILWFDYRDGYGIAVGDDDSEYYIDSSVIDHPEYAIRGVRVSFVLNDSIRGTNCGKDVRIDLDHAAQLQYRIVESLQAYGADKLRPGAIEAALNRLSEIVALKSKFRVRVLVREEPLPTYRDEEREGCAMPDGYLHGRPVYFGDTELSGCDSFFMSAYWADTEGLDELNDDDLSELTDKYGDYLCEQNMEHFGYWPD